MNFEIKEKEKVESITENSFTDLIYHTITKLNKQIIVFNNSKKNSITTAEICFNNLPEIKDEKIKKELEQISDSLLNVLEVPTKQCILLSKFVKKGVVFHHAGLLSKQREIIEKNFRKGIIKIISSTPTLAFGLNLPAYMVIIKDYKRYGKNGFKFIPILEYHQMAGRAGRPGKEKIGKTIIIQKNENDEKKILENYIFGEPEKIISKLSIIPTLKMYVLTLISLEIVNTKEEITKFFTNTLYAKQFGDLEYLKDLIFQIINKLISYKFVINEENYYLATPLGKKISQLYINPDTANYYISNFKKIEDLFNGKKYTDKEIFILLHFFMFSYELKPLFSVKKEEIEKYFNFLYKINDNLIIKFDEDFDEYIFLTTLKTTKILYNWINEMSEERIMEKYSITPGELNYKIETLDWLLYSFGELSQLNKNYFLKNLINKLRKRLIYGIKEELIPLINLKYIGKVKARKLFENGIKTPYELKIANFEKVSNIIGKKTTENLKKILHLNYENSLDNQFNSPKKLVEKTDINDLELDKIISEYQKIDEENENKKLTDFF